MQIGDFAYHMLGEFFCKISHIYVDSSSDLVYYGVYSLEGKYLGSYQAANFLQASRC